MNKWEVDEHEWCEKVRGHRFCPPLLGKNRNYKGTVAKLSIATGHAMQIYNCLGQLRQLLICIA